MDNLKSLDYQETTVQWDEWGCQTMMHPSLNMQKEKWTNYNRLFVCLVYRSANFM